MPSQSKATTQVDLLNAVVRQRAAEEQYNEYQRRDAIERQRAAEEAARQSMMEELQSQRELLSYVATWFCGELEVSGRRPNGHYDIIEWQAPYPRSPSYKLSVDTLNMVWRISHEHVSAPLDSLHGLRRLKKFIEVLDPTGQSFIDVLGEGVFRVAREYGLSLDTFVYSKD